MLVFLIVVSVLIGLAYADYCLIDNTEHFGRCFGKLAEAQEAEEALEALRAEVEETVAPAAIDGTGHEDSPVDHVAVPGSGASARVGRNGVPVRPPRHPAPAWVLLDLEPVLELHEGWSAASN